jgi:hypothetical protein
VRTGNFFWRLDLENCIENFKPDLMITCKPSASCLMGEDEWMNRAKIEWNQSKREGNPTPSLHPNFHNTDQACFRRNKGDALYQVRG